MVKHAIVLASRNWCEAAASGRVKVYDFVKPRKRRIHALGPGSVCVVMTRAEPNKPSVLYGEFTVVEVKEADAREYSRLASQGLIFNPQRLGPNDKRWIILFDEFRKYRREVPRRELTDVRTSPDRNPISEWRIYGLSYINDHVLEAIRTRAGGFAEREAESFPSLNDRLRELEERLSVISELLGISELPFPITHECAELMLLKVGRYLGFNVYTSDPSRACSGIRLGDLANMSKNDLGRYAGSEILTPLSRIDVVWFKQGSGFYAFEVVVGGSMHDALLRLSRISELNAKLFIVSDETKENDYRDSIQNPAFSSIRRKYGFITLGKLVKMYILTSLWRSSIEDLRLPFLTR